MRSNKSVTCKTVVALYLTGYSQPYLFACRLYTTHQPYAMPMGLMRGENQQPLPHLGFHAARPVWTRAATAGKSHQQLTGYGQRRWQHLSPPKPWEIKRVLG